MAIPVSSFEIAFVLAVMLFSMPSLSGVHGWSLMDRKTFVRHSGMIAFGCVVIGTTAGKANAAAAEFPKHYIYEPTPNSLTGQVHLITGATGGLGLESAKRLAAGGATVILTARTAAKGEAAQSKVQDYLREKQIDNPHVYFLTLDLEHLDSVRSFPNRYQQLMVEKNNNQTAITVLMNNAGRINNRRELTDDGFETTFQTNHLGPFLLTALLFPYLDQRGSRVINVSSVGHRFATVGGTSTERGLNLENLDGSLYSKWGGGWKAYGATKLENILFTEELQRRADAAGLAWLSSVSLHPGLVGTDIWRNQYVGRRGEVDNNNSRFSLRRLVSSLFYKSILTTAEGANTQVFLASIKPDQLDKGRYYNEKGVVTKVPNYAQDPVVSKALWETSEKLANVQFLVQ